MFTVALASKAALKFRSIPGIVSVAGGALAEEGCTNSPGNWILNSVSAITGDAEVNKIAGRVIFNKFNFSFML